MQVTQLVTDSSQKLANNTYLLDDKVQGIHIIGYEEIKQVIFK